MMIHIHVIKDNIGGESYAGQQWYGVGYLGRIQKRCN